MGYCRHCLYLFAPGLTPSTQPAVMNIFNGNTRLEEAIFTGMDYALWSRHDLRTPFTPFALLFKNGRPQLCRIVTDGDPNDMFTKMLQADTTVYDQVVLCCEGRIHHDGTPQDAILVKGFDTSTATGLLFGQRFRGLESGKPFVKLGNPALYSNKEPLPAALVERQSNKTIEPPFVSAMIVNGNDELSQRVVVIGHNNGSTIGNLIVDNTLAILEQNEPGFSGVFTYKLVPGRLRITPFETFIFAQVQQTLLSHAIVQQWQNQWGRTLQLTIEYDAADVVAEPPASLPAEKNSAAADTGEYTRLSEADLLQELQRIAAIPGARTDMDYLLRVSNLLKEYDRRGLPKPTSAQIYVPQKKWWQFWK